MPENKIVIKKIKDSCLGKYAKVIDFSKSKNILFPDFSLTFLGTDKEVPKFNKKLLIKTYKFRISNEKEKKQITWSSGTGRVAPRYFEISGKKFILEMVSSEKFGDIGRGKKKQTLLVITKEIMII
ncbi:MAG: hypothetical protein WCW44_03420 [archaeon]|jgi:hypothetical protein